MEQKWPQQIWIVRHGQSAGYVARDADAALSALGDCFATLPPEQQPTVVLYSPYVRAQQTAQAVLAIGKAADVPNCGITSYAFPAALLAA